ncbi:hypothetical protein H4W00_000375 [Psychrobacter sp. PL19]|uniref:hypothetical protein n=1 Tax=Psychrobacter sp. PL19 TaxID=2760711 RepID=UPI001AE537F3
MSTKSESSANDPSAGQQRRQANILLLRLQWLLILLLIAALLWLYISQQRFQIYVNERLQSNEQVVSRLNEMDDRLFAISQQSLPPPSATVGSQAQNQLELLRIQIHAADRLLADNNDTAAVDLLRSLQWQLSQNNNEIAPALTIVIKKSLTKDIERLQAQSSQPSPWQLQNLAIQNIQEFLYSYERVNRFEPINNRKNQTPINSSAAQKSPKQLSVFVNPAASANVALIRKQLTIHEVIMTLNLASQASNMREKDQLVAYLSQARNQLQTLVAEVSSTSKNKITDHATSQSATKNNTKNYEKPSNLETTTAPKDISEVILWLDKLVANSPTPTTLLTNQILDRPKR